MHVHHNPLCVIYLHTSCLQMQGCNVVVGTTVFSFIYPKLALKSLMRETTWEVYSLLIIKCMWEGFEDCNVCVNCNNKAKGN